MVCREEIRSWLRGLKEQLLLICALALFLAWIGTFEFSNTFFRGYDYLINSVFSSFATAVSVLVVILLLYVAKKRPVSSRFENYQVFVGAVVLALFSLSTFFFHPNQTNYLFSGIQGAVIGIGFALLLVGMGRKLIATQRAGIEVLVLSFVLALFLFLVFMSFSEQVLPFVLFLSPLVALALYSVYCSRKTTDTPLAERCEPTKINRPTTLLFALFSSGFLLQYMIVFHPKSARGAGMFVESALGGLGVSGLLSLLVCCVLLVLIMVSVQQRLRSSFFFIFVIALFAASFSAFPFMQTNPIPYILVTPCALCALLLSLFMLASSQGFDLGKHTEKTYLQGLLMVGAGACCSTLTAVIFFIFVWHTPFQRQYIIIPTAAVTLLIVILLVYTLRAPFAVAFFGEKLQTETRPLDGTKLADCCTALGRKYSLTAREIEVLLLVAEGRNAPYIEKKLVVSRSTAKAHLSNIYRKAGVSSRQDLIDLIHADSFELP